MVVDQLVATKASILYVASIAKPIPKERHKVYRI